MKKHALILLISILLLLVFHTYRTIQVVKKTVSAQKTELEEKNRLFSERKQISSELDLLDTELANLSLRNKELLDQIGENAGSLLEAYKSKTK